MLAGFFFVLLAVRAGARATTSLGSPLHDDYLRATTMTFAGIVACQVGTAVAARTERASLRSVGLFTNPMLLWGIAFELVFAAALIYVPPLQDVFGTRPRASRARAARDLPRRRLGRRRVAPCASPRRDGKAVARIRGAADEPPRTA